MGKGSGRQGVGYLADIAIAGRGARRLRLLSSPLSGGRSGGGSQAKGAFIARGPHVRCSPLPTGRKFGGLAAAGGGDVRDDSPARRSYPSKSFPGAPRRAGPGGPAGAETPTPPGPWPTAPCRQPKIVPRTMVRFTRRARGRIVRSGRERGVSWTGGRRARIVGSGRPVAARVSSSPVFSMACALSLRIEARFSGCFRPVSARSCPG